MIAFVFPGQGAQYVGMGKEFYDQFPAAKQVFEEASDMLSFDMSRLCFEDNTEKLNLTANAQPAILTASIAALRVLNQETGIRPDFVAGHSLGEYSALVASGAMNFKDAVHTVRKRGEFMQSAVPIGIGAMAAVIGLSKEEIENICERVTSSQSIVSSANYNSPQQTVISGHKEAVQRAEGMLKEAGAKRIVPLSVSAPFHCKLMNKAAENLSEVLNDIRVSEIETPVVTNVESIANSDKTRVKDLLVQQVVKPVRWFESIQYLAEQKVKNFVEIGPGKVLTGLIRKTIKEVNLINLENITQLAHIKKNGI